MKAKKAPQGLMVRITRKTKTEKAANPDGSPHKAERGKGEKRGKRKRWMGTPPSSCDICAEPLTSCFVDGATLQGPWGNMCPKCHGLCGMGLGTGRGQRYELNKTDGHWYKTGG